MNTQDSMNQSMATAGAATATPATSPLKAQLVDKFTEELSGKQDRMVQLLMELCAGVQEKVPLGDFDWKQILDVSEGIFNDYSQTMESITRELDELNREFLIWQESAYILDSEKVAKRLGVQEHWINWKESHLQYTNEEMMKSAGVIEQAINKLSSK